MDVYTRRHYLNRVGVYTSITVELRMTQGIAEFQERWPETESTRLFPRQDSAIPISVPF
ncbi:hypothetical protein DL93DRAFT_2070694 [Clavulina sp. PMI_390]|nr:hypothetical protein DL93DRAFT_2070694 [Clavulina sp. PMI_390]